MFKRKLNYLTVDTFRGKLMQRTITLDFNNMLGAINGILLLFIYLFIIIMIVIYLWFQHFKTNLHGSYNCMCSIGLINKYSYFRHVYIVYGKQIRVKTDLRTEN